MLDDGLTECDQEWVRQRFPAEDWTLRCYRRPSGKWTVMVHARRGRIDASGYATRSQTARTAHVAALRLAGARPMKMARDVPVVEEPPERVESEFIRIRRDGWVKPAGG
jgi:hypothetical protein